MDSALPGENFSVISGCFGSAVGVRVIHLDSVGSTMDVLSQMADDGEPEGTVVIADEQTAGRGRHGRAWLSRPGDDLLFSALFRPRPALAVELQIIGALAIADTAVRFTDKHVGIKWPNDVMVEGRKLAGVLVESRQTGGRMSSVLGAGVNVNSKASAFAASGLTATSLMELAGSPVSRKEVLTSVLRALAGLYERLLSGETLVPAWRERLETLGARVTVHAGGGAGGRLVVEGVAEDVDEFGRLLVRDATGRVAPVSAGEVTLRQDR